MLILGACLFSLPVLKDGCLLGMFVVGILMVIAMQ
jgi:hypothetical protein